MLTSNLFTYLQSPSESLYPATLGGPKPAPGNGRIARDTPKANERG
ncbi:unannotated protein [freshwater metagenome]|uniref:Unannotated protein n=1 Tax=freshwater metagenome TaxID=449393 RepID=A0A6J6VCL2_9ZZZZ